MKRYILIPALAAVTAIPASADFDDRFDNRTLRLDYVLSGSKSNSTTPTIALADIITSPGWFGRKHNLNHPALDGNAQVVMTSLAGDTIFTTSFSSLYFEWLTTDEKIPGAFQHSILVPMPKDKANVSVIMRDVHHDELARHTLLIDPDEILIRPTDNIQPLPYKIIHSATHSNPIDIAILPEGYTAGEMDKFYERALFTANEIMSYEPFKSFTDRLNFVAVDVPSNQTGVSVPRNNDWCDTAFGAKFDTFHSNRYMTSNQIFNMHNALIGIPYEHIIVLANTDTYGGAGIFNDYILAAADNEKFPEVVVHEFAHSFGGLADEYFYETDVMNDTYPTDIEPWEPNITTLVNFDSKWADMVPAKTPIPTDPKKATKYPVGVFEGGGYSFHGVYRPADECRMRNNTWPSFCPVCTRAIERVIRHHTEPIK